MDPVGTGWTKHDRICIVHGVLAGVATVVLVPTGVLIRRYVYPRGRWFAVHVIIMGTAFALILVSFGLVTNLVGNQFMGSGEEIIHHKLGLAAFVVMAVQVLIGIGAHFTRGNEEESVPRHPTRWLHKFLGIAVLGLLYATVYQGFYEWGFTSDKMTTVPLAVKIVFWVCLGTFLAVYILGLGLGLRKAASGSGKATEIEKGSA